MSAEGSACSLNRTSCNLPPLCCCCIEHAKCKDRVLNHQIKTGVAALHEVTGNHWEAFKFKLCREVICAQCWSVWRPTWLDALYKGLVGNELCIQTQRPGVQLIAMLRLLRAWLSAHLQHRDAFISEWR